MLGRLVMLEQNIMYCSDDQCCEIMDYEGVSAFFLDGNFRVYRVLVLDLWVYMEGLMN